MLVADVEIIFVYDLQSYKDEYFDPWYGVNYMAFNVSLQSCVCVSLWPPTSQKLRCPLAVACSLSWVIL